MKNSSSLLLVVLVLLCHASCRKENKYSNLAKVYPCTEFTTPVHNDVESHLSAYDKTINVFNDGYVLVRDESSGCKLFDENLKFSRNMNFLNTTNFMCLSDNSILTRETVYGPTSNSSTVRDLYGWKEIGRDANCEPVYNYGLDTAVVAAKSKIETLLSMYTRNGDFQYSLMLDGKVSTDQDKGWMVEAYGYFYVATVEKDSTGYKPGKDKGGFYNDTITRFTDATLNLHKFSYYGEMIWKKSIPGLMSYFPDRATLGASSNFLWVCTKHDILQLDFDGNLTNRGCNTMQLYPAQFLSSGVYGSTGQGGSDGYKLLTENFQYKALPSSARAGFASHGNLVYSVGVDGINTFNVLNTQVSEIYNEKDGGWVYYRGISKGCDGSFYFVSYINNNPENILVRVNKDGKSSF